MQSNEIIMFRCPYCERKLKSKSSLNRHTREACKKKKAWKPTSEIKYLQSPSGDSYVSAMANPEYVLPVPASAAGKSDSAGYNIDNVFHLSPLKSPPLKRSSASLDNCCVDPRVLNFEGTTLNANGYSTDDIAMDFADNDSTIFGVDSDDLSADSIRIVETPAEVGVCDSDSVSVSNACPPDDSDELNSQVSKDTRLSVDVFEDDDSESFLLSSDSELSLNLGEIPTTIPCVCENEESEFYEDGDFIDVTECVNSESPKDLSIEEELLLHIIKEEQLPPRVFDRIMKWGKLCRENNYDFDAPGFRTAMKRWKQHYLNSALKEPFLEFVQEEWQSNPTQIPVIDPFPQITAILNNSDLMQGALWKSDHGVAEDGTKLYGDINTGTQWCKAERRMNSRINERDPHSACHHYCGVLLFDDNTLGDGLGRLQIQPVLGTLCILSKKSRRNVKAWFLLGIVPPYPRTSQERAADRNKNKSKHQYLQWYHACLEKILAPLKKLCSNRKGIPFLIDGRCRILHFELAGIIGDTKGHAEMCANYNAHSSVISKCNRDCDVPQSKADDPYVCCLRTQAKDVYEVVEEALNLQNTTDRENKSARDEVKLKLKSISQHPVLPYYSQFDFGGDTEGVFGSTPWELLHVWYLGIMKLILFGCYNLSCTNAELIKWYRHRLRGHSKGDLSNRPTVSAGMGKNAVLFPKPKLEERLRYIQTYSRRQSDRYMPRGPFREGVTDLTRLSGQEYPGLTLFSMVAFKGIFHDTRLEKEKGSSFAADLERRMCLLCFLSLSLEVELTKESISERQRSKLEKKVLLFLDFFRRTLGVFIEYGSRTGLRRPKFHAPIHIVRNVIPKYGSTTNTFGGYLESFLRILVKEPLKRTSRKHGSFQWELVNRYSEEMVRRASADRLSACGYDISVSCETMDAQQSVSQSGSASSRMTNSTSKGWWFTPGGTVFYCERNEVTGEWETFSSEKKKLLQGLHHPGYPGNADAINWVVRMVHEAERLTEESSNPSKNYKRIDFTYHLKTPNSNDDAHDIFRCNPNFHGTVRKKNPWHDWAMVRYEVEENNVTEVYDVAAKVCLWGILRDSNCSGTQIENLDVLGAFHPMKQYRPPVDETMPFLQKDVLAKDIEILSFDVVVSTAYVLPINWVRTEGFPTSAENVKAHCIIPPRSSWPDMGWDDKLLRDSAMKDTRNLPLF